MDQMFDHWSKSCRFSSGIAAQFVSEPLQNCAVAYQTGQFALLFQCLPTK